jgi:hypothetical protein
MSGPPSPPLPTPEPEEPENRRDVGGGDDVRWDVELENAKGVIATMSHRTAAE